MYKIQRMYRLIDFGVILLLCGQSSEFGEGLLKELRRAELICSIFHVFVIVENAARCAQYSLLGDLSNIAWML